MPNILEDVRGQYNLGNQMWTDLMKKIQGVQSGRITPQELPQFKQMQEYVNKLGGITDQNLMREEAGRGVTGGALSDLMRRSQEQRNQEMMKVINQLYGQAGQMAPQVGQQGMEPFWKMAQLWSQRKGQHSRQNLIKTQMWMEGISKALQLVGVAAAGGMAGGSMGAGSAGAGMGATGGMGGSQAMSNQFQQYPWTWGQTW